MLLNASPVTLDMANRIAMGLIGPQRRETGFGYRSYGIARPWAIRAARHCSFPVTIAPGTIVLLSPPAIRSSYCPAVDRIARRLSFQADRPCKKNLVFHMLRLSAHWPEMRPLTCHLLTGNDWKETTYRKRAAPSHATYCMHVKHSVSASQHLKRVFVRFSVKF
jgi:hypothetical protein